MTVVGSVRENRGRRGGGVERGGGDSGEGYINMMIFISRTMN